MSSQPRLSFLAELADAAGAATLPHFRAGLPAESKGSGAFDPVTAADREAELAMRALIRERFPEDGIVGEEFGAHDPGARTVWYLDPIDGTRSFIAGVPLWGTLIGFAENGRPAGGMMAQPFTGERYWGDGAEAHYEGPDGVKRLSTRRGRTIEQATLFTTSPDLFAPDEQAAYGRVEKAARLARYGADCYAYCMLAAGYVDLVVESGLNAFDILALIPIIEGAGGRVTDWEGGSAAAGGRVLAAGDARLHEEAMRLLAGK